MMIYQLGNYSFIIKCGVFRIFSFQSRKSFVRIAKHLGITQISRKINSRYHFCPKISEIGPWVSRKKLM